MKKKGTSEVDITVVLRDKLLPTMGEEGGEFSKSEITVEIFPGEEPMGGDKTGQFLRTT